MGIDTTKRESYQHYQQWHEAAEITGIVSGIGAIFAFFPGLLPIGAIMAKDMRSFLKLAVKLYGAVGVVGLGAGCMYLEGERRKGVVEKELPLVGDCRRFSLTTMQPYDVEKAMRQGLLGGHAAQSFATANAVWRQVEGQKQGELAEIESDKERQIDALIQEEDPLGFPNFAARQDTILQWQTAKNGEIEQRWNPKQAFLENWYAKQLYVSHQDEVRDGPLVTEAAFIGGLQ